VIGLYILVSLFSSWIWIYYLRAIDIFEKENIRDILKYFGIGLITPFWVLGLHQIGLKDLFPGTDFLQVALTCLFEIALVEELAKMLPFVVLYPLLKPKINEPIDILIYFAASALGFSAVENVIYYMNHGGSIILARTILPTLSHLMDSVIIGYGFVLYQYRKEKHGIGILFICFGLAVLSHGIYDFWLIYYPNTFLGAVAHLIYFLFTVSIFSSMMENALSNSPLFTYKKLINSQRLSKNMHIYFAVLILIQLIVVGIELDVEHALIYMIANSIQLFLITFISISRISKFKLIKKRWNPIKLELPVHVVGFSGSLIAPLSLAVKGDGFNETYINSYLEKPCLVRPLTLRDSYLEEDFEGEVLDKIHLDRDMSFYKLTLELAKGRTKQYLLKPKTFGRTLMAEQYPIAALLEIDDPEKLNNPETSLFDFPFLEWVYLKPIAWENQVLKVGRVSDD